MKVSVNWIKEWVDVDLGIDQLVEKIGSQLGAVEEITDLSKKYQGIIVAKVVACEKHPNADKLSLCKIDDDKKVKGVERDKNGLVQVVCGAPNVRAGMLVAWLPPGSTVPSSYDKEPFVLEARELRGKVSNGMLASASELDLSDDHSGILELDSGEPGDDFAATLELNDYIIDIENKMFTHRPDCFGILGVAREIAGITGKQFTTPDWYLKPEPLKENGERKLALKNSCKLVPRFSARVIEDVKVGPSPVWMQAYLARVGIRPINNIVDVTNWVMFLTGQPLHAYDYDKLCRVANTDVVNLETRLSKKGDTLKLINGKEISFEDTETILITSNDVPVGMGGIMGGAETEVDESTSNIVVECANFDMYAIRRASMRHGLFTDAVTRFNKGQSALMNAAILQKTSDLMSRYAGKLGPIQDEHAQLKHPLTVHVTADFINSRLGLSMSIKQMAQLLTNVEFDVRINGPTLAVTPPAWRTDISIEEDVLEEVGRLYGFDNLPLELPRRSIQPVSHSPILALKSQIRQTLAAAGANELYLYSFVHGNLLEKTGQDSRKAFQLSNAISPDLQYYRLSLTPSLLDKVHPNIKSGYDEFVIFELGKTHNKDFKDANESNLPKENQHISLIVAADDKLKYETPAYYRARRYADLLAEKINSEFTYRPLTNAPTDQVAQPFEPSRSAEIVLPNGEVAGLIGEYKSSVRRTLKLPKYCAGFEIDITTLLAVAGSKTYRPLSRFPSLSQDICLRSDKAVQFADLERVVREALAKEDNATEVEPIDIYQKEGSDKKQTTFRITVTSYERTLTDDYVSGLLDKVAAAAQKTLKAQRV